MLALLTFNKRLGWVVAACVVWSLIGLTVAIGRGPGSGRADLAFRLSMGLAQNSIIVDGQVLSIIEDEQKLAIIVRTRPEGKQQAYHPGGKVVSELPDNLQITFTTEGERRPGPPKVKLLSGAKQAKEVAPKRWGLLTQNYAIKFDPGHLRIIPKPANAKPGWWRKFIQQKPGHPGKLPFQKDGMRQIRPGEGQRPGRFEDGPPGQGPVGRPPLQDDRVGGPPRRPPPHRPNDQPGKPGPGR